MSEDPSSDAAISRRQFVRLSAATGGALALPTATAAEVTASAFTDEYAYAVTHLPAAHELPTLVEVADAATLETVESIVVRPAGPHPPPTSTSAPHAASAAWNFRATT